MLLDNFKGGRPQKQINQTEFEKLCALQCTENEICAWFDVSDKTLNSWCKRTYKMGFSEVFAIKRCKGKIALRRSQVQLAAKSAAMAIFLGKQYLEQKDESSKRLSVIQHNSYQKDIDVNSLTDEELDQLEKLISKASS